SQEFITGQRDYFLSPRIDLSGSFATNLIFSVAYAQAIDTATFDTLKVLISIDCGETWTVLYNKSGATLATRPPLTSSFTPTASQWRSDTISLAAYTAQPEVLFQFVTIADDGNNIYIDDIQIPSFPTSVAQHPAARELSVYPNPGNGNFTV